MSADLSPLEQAAARVGLPGLKARVVPHDRRRGWWFRWGGGELLVSEKVIERCPPQDACALLYAEVFRQRHVRPVRNTVLALVLGVILAEGIFALLMVVGILDIDRLERWSWYLYAAGVLVVSACLYVAQRSRAIEGADDQTVALLGDATPLVRGLNEMDFEEIHLAGKVLPARPDLHRRAERLVRKHGLCEAQPPA
jgi:hypothetical protein